MNKLVKTVEKDSLCREFIETLNGILQLTEREKDLLLLLIELDINSPKIPGYNKNVISTENRKYLRDKTGVTNDNLSRYLQKLKDKGLVVKGKADDEWYVNPAVIPEIIGDRVQITIVLKINKK